MPVMWSFYLEGHQATLKDFKLGVKIRRLTFQKAHFSSSVNMDWREAELEAWEPARRLQHQGGDEGHN